jgi:hypothetical protein
MVRLPTAVKGLILLLQMLLLRMLLLRMLLLQMLLLRMLLPLKVKIQTLRPPTPRKQPF